MTLYELARQFVGKVKERPGADSDPAILWAHSLTTLRATSDEVAWCSSMMNLWCYLLDLPRTRSARARSWLNVGDFWVLGDAEPAFDIVIFNRGGSPDATVEDSPGHVAVFAGLIQGKVQVIGGNQSDGVTIATWPISQVLGVRRLSRSQSMS